jgi:succinoglycan biosynthesis protein ExoA
VTAEASRPAGEPLPPLSRWPAVSVFIPARDCADTLEAAVQSALTQRFDGSIEVVIAAAPSEDGTEELAGRLSHDHPRIRYRPNPVGTTPAGLNAAIATARGDVLVRLDAHAQLPTGYIQRAVELLRETGSGNVGGMQVATGETAFGRAVALAMASPLGSGGARYRVGGDPGDVETVYLGVFRREALEAVGGFDESLIRNQDYELNHRLRVAGFRVYFHPDLRVAYQPRQTLAALWSQYLDYGAWKRHVAALHPGSLRPRQLLPPVAVVGLAGLVAAAGASGVWWPLGIAVAVYLVALVVGALAAAARRGEPVRLVPLVVVALTAMHLAWGLGFLVGRRRGGDP